MVPLALLACLAGVHEPPQPLADAGIFAATPIALGTGQLIGPSLDARLQGPWSFGVRARLGFADADDPDWHVQHTELHLSAIASYVRPIGRGEASVSVTAGGVALREHRIRHQAERLMTAGLDPETYGFAAGALVSLEAAIRLFVFDGFGVAIDGGPNLGIISSAPDAAPRLGISVGLSITYAFAIDGPAL